MILGERFHLELSADSFNLFNRNNKTGNNQQRFSELRPDNSSSTPNTQEILTILLIISSLRVY